MISHNVHTAPEDNTVTADPRPEQLGLAGTKRAPDVLEHEANGNDNDHGFVIQTTKSKGIVNVQLFIRSKSSNFSLLLNVALSFLSVSF